MIIRRLLPSYWQQLREIRLESLKEAGFAFGSSYENEVKFSDRQWQDLLSSEESFYFAAITIANEIAALAGIRRYPNKQWFVVGVYVKPKHRGQGVIQQLLKYLIEYNQEMVLNSGFPLALTVIISNVSAIRIYQQLGFKIMQQLEPRQMGDGSLSAEYRMELIISEK